MLNIELLLKKKSKSKSTFIGNHNKKSRMEKVIWRLFKQSEVKDSF